MKKALTEGGRRFWWGEQHGQKHTSGSGAKAKPERIACISTPIHSFMHDRSAASHRIEGCKGPPWFLVRSRQIQRASNGRTLDQETHRVQNTTRRQRTTLRRRESRPSQPLGSSFLSGGGWSLLVMEAHLSQTSKNYQKMREGYEDILLPINQNVSTTFHIVQSPDGYFPQDPLGQLIPS
jgi:hypothetical protein